MGMIMAILGGFLGIILGLVGLIFWFGHFIRLLQGTLPIIFIFGGAIALFIGITEIKDTLKSKEEESRMNLSPEPGKPSRSFGESKEEEEEKEETKGKTD